MKEIELSQGAVATVDDDDYEWLSQWKWYVNHGYAVRNASLVNGKQTTVRMHRVITRCPNDLEVDHIDGNSLNNCKENLRVVPHSLNAKNRGADKDAKEPYKGISWNKHNKRWVAQAALDGSMRH